jgi:hypothetical protein
MNFDDKLQEAFEEGYRQAINEQKKPLGPKRPGALLKKAYNPRKYFNAHVEKELVNVYKKLMARLKSDYEKKAIEQTFPFELADEIKKKVENLFDGDSMRDELIDMYQNDFKKRDRLKDYDKRVRHGFSKYPRGK